MQLRIPGGFARVDTYGSVPHAAQAPQFTREGCKEER